MSFVMKSKPIVEIELCFLLFFFITSRKGYRADQSYRNDRLILLVSSLYLLSSYSDQLLLWNQSVILSQISEKDSRFLRMRLFYDAYLALTVYLFSSWLALVFLLIDKSCTSNWSWNILFFSRADPKSPVQQGCDRNTATPNNNNNNERKRLHSKHDSNFESDHTKTTAGSGEKVSKLVKKNGEFSGVES